mmetsp:Transcript_70104/g.102734  ORF Transcript_70104/g.102734 Transcript_70104/m.102734 type:complete len:281 (+) Transcript_70104:1623-2465(+)
MRFSRTCARPAARAHWIIRRPMTSCAQTVSTRPFPTISTRCLLSTSRSSHTTCAGSSWLHLFSIPLSDKIWRTMRESASSGSKPSDRAIMARAVCTDTLARSCSASVLPLRKITSEPLSCRPPSLLSMAALSSASISSFSFLASTTMMPPPSLSLASEICWMIASDMSDHPSMSVCELSITRDLPFFKSSTFSPIKSEIIPIIKANTHMPPMVVENATIRMPVPSASACVPGSATYVHDRHMAVEMSSPETNAKPMVDDRMSTNVTAKSNRGLAILLAEK